jgi:hypothetical protein
MGEAVMVGLWNILVFLSNFLVKTIIVAGATVLFHNAGWAIAAILLVIVAVFAFFALRRRR